MTEKQLTTNQERARGIIQRLVRPYQIAFGAVIGAVSSFHAFQMLEGWEYIAAQGIIAVIVSIGMMWLYKHPIVLNRLETLVAFRFRW